MTARSGRVPAPWRPPRSAAQSLRDQTKHVVPFDLRAHDVDRREPGPINRGKQMANQRRLAGADIAGDDDEALTLRQPVAEIRHRLAMRPALVPETRVGRQLEGLFAEAVVIRIHAASPPGDWAGTD